MSDEPRTLAPVNGRAMQGWNVALWILQIALAAMFISAGTVKLLGQPEMIAMFDEIGVGQWLRYVTGGLEVCSAVLLLVPSLAAFGAVFLAATMVGAILTHLFAIGGSVLFHIVLLTGAIVVVLGRWKEHWRGVAS